MEVPSKGQEKGNKRDAKRKGNQEGGCFKKGGGNSSPIITTAFSSQSHFFQRLFPWKYITRIELEKKKEKKGKEKKRKEKQRRLE